MRAIMGEDTATHLANWRVRAATLLAGACIVVATCVLLVWLSHVVALEDGRAAPGVEVLLSPRIAAPRQRAPRSPAPQTAATSDVTAPTTTALPVGQAMLARTLSCAHPRPDRRPADCPPSVQQEADAQVQLPVGGDFAPPEPLRLDRAFTVAERATLLTPSCKRDGAGGMVSVCMSVGPTPPPPTRSPEEICDAGGIGPCHPPAFREEDVVHLAHTQ